MKPEQSSQPPLTFERSYHAQISDLWDLWTTKEGFESWWGPEGFRVQVHELDLRLGGQLRYDMIAVGAQEIAFMKAAGMATSQPTHGTFTDIQPLRVLAIRHVIDFFPNVAAYNNDMRIEFSSEGESARMLITVDAHPNPFFTQQAKAGMLSQLNKVAGALAQLKK